MSGAVQEILPFDVKLSLLAEDFFISESNREAAALIHNWPGWPAYGMYLYGPPASGKTHLAHLWQQQSKALAITDIQRSPAAFTQPVLLENIESYTDEKALFHLLNSVKEAGTSLLLTSSLPPAKLPFTLPDLCSRLKALPSVQLATPDEALLKAVLCKHFADRQLQVDAEVIAYLLTRMERSFAGAQSLAHAIDEAAVRERRPATVPFVRKVMGW